MVKKIISILFQVFTQENFFYNQVVKTLNGIIAQFPIQLHCCSGPLLSLLGMWWGCWPFSGPRKMCLGSFIVPYILCNSHSNHLLKTLALKVMHFSCSCRAPSHSSVGSKPSLQEEIPRSQAPLRSYTEGLQSHDHFQLDRTSHYQQVSIITAKINAHQQVSMVTAKISAYFSAHF